MNYIKQTTEQLIQTYNTRCPYELAEHLGIEVYEFPFRKIRGLIINMEREERKIVGLNSELPVDEKRVVLTHEIGHDTLHPAKVGYFSMKENGIFIPGKLEREANMFVAMLLLESKPEYGETCKEYAAREGVTEEIIKVRYKILW